MVEGYRLEEDETVKELDPPLDLKEMFLLAIATSIDALAVGITFAFLNYPIVECITIIGLTTSCYPLSVLLSGICSEADTRKRQRSPEVLS